MFLKPVRIVLGFHFFGYPSAVMGRKKIAVNYKCSVIFGDCI